MAMYNAQIRIYGKIDDVEVANGLCTIAYQESVSIDWGEDASSSDIALEIVRAAKEGDAIEFRRANTSHTLRRIANFCYSYGLGYHLSLAEPDTEVFHSVEVWKPGYSRIVNFDLLDGFPMVSLPDLKAAAEQGMEGVNALIASFDVNAQPGIIELEANVLQEMEIRSRVGASMAV